ncbi:hypothetical protein EDD18DRAFT_1100449 [Armillaria luteobubalina]|uniref:Hypervirulence associated protein TUDOR domain-containing protein n=1 Tax=Armillaria luteobubalina TaxID=153913 RepID=A0AA39QHV8_9AGAR|nr:hypothetical protein EDD18DRAFT_1100449 [Armillaria luteobubalina]
MYNLLRYERYLCTFLLVDLLLIRHIRAKCGMRRQDYTQLQPCDGQQKRDTQVHKRKASDVNEVSSDKDEGTATKSSKTTRGHYVRNIQVDHVGTLLTATPKHRQEPSVLIVTAKLTAEAVIVTTQTEEKGTVPVIHSGRESQRHVEVELSGDANTEDTQ